MLTLLLGWVAIRNATKWWATFKVVYIEFSKNQGPILIYNLGYEKKKKNYESDSQGI